MNTAPYLQLYQWIIAKRPRSIDAPFGWQRGQVVALESDGVVVKFDWDSARIKVPFQDVRTK